MTEKALGAGFVTLAVEISETVEQKDGKGKRVSLGVINPPCPTLISFGINAAYASEEPTHTEEGVPIYADKVSNWLMSCIRSKIIADARNCLVPKTLEMKPDAAFDCTLEDIVTRAGRDGDALKAMHEGAAAFAGHVAAKGKSPEVVAQWKKLFRDKTFMASQADPLKALARTYLSEFIDSLSKDNPELLARYSNAITAADEAATSKAISLDQM